MEEEDTDSEAEINPGPELEEQVRQGNEAPEEPQVHTITGGGCRYTRKNRKRLQVPAD